MATRQSAFVVATYIIGPLVATDHAHSNVLESGRRWDRQAPNQLVGGEMQQLILVALYSHPFGTRATRGHSSAPQQCKCHSHTS